MSRSLWSAKKQPNHPTTTKTLPTAAFFALLGASSTTRSHCLGKVYFWVSLCLYAQQISDGVGARVAFFPVEEAARKSDNVALIDFVWYRFLTFDTFSYSLHS